jgi:hypothetical protein
MRADTIAALLRLGKGRNAVSAVELMEICADIQGARVEEIRAALGAKLAPRRPRAPAPDWLAAMQRAQKRIKWSAREAVDTLFEIAVRDGLWPADAARPAQLSFAKAAERIAARASGEAVRRAFVAFVDEHTRANARG